MLALWGRKPCFRPRACEAWLRMGKAGARLPQSKEAAILDRQPEKIPDSIGTSRQWRPSLLWETLRQSA
jgi:hypothetical protein